MDNKHELEIIKKKLKLELRLLNNRLSTLELELTEIEIFGGDAEYIEHIKTTIEATKEYIEELEGLEQLNDLAIYAIKESN